MKNIWWLSSLRITLWSMNTMKEGLLRKKLSINKKNAWFEWSDCQIGLSSVPFNITILYYYSLFYNNVYCIHCCLGNIKAMLFMPIKESDITVFLQFPIVSAGRYWLVHRETKRPIGPRLYGTWMVSLGKGAAYRIQSCLSLVLGSSLINTTESILLIATMCLGPQTSSGCHRARGLVGMTVCCLWNVMFSFS